MPPYFILFALFGSLLCADDLPIDTSSLQLLHIIARHGARTPVYLQPNDPNNNGQFKEGLGQLTNTGKLQHYILGKYFRERYDNYITSNPNEVVARSTQMDRTIMSGLCHLAGLYAPTEEWQFDDELPWQPIKIFSPPSYEDRLLSVGAECPEAVAESNRIKNSPEVKAYWKQYTELFKYVSNHSGIAANDWLSVLLFFDAIKIEKSNNMTVPYWVTEEVYQKLEKISDNFFYFMYKTEKIQRLRTGPLLGEIVKHMQEKDEGEHTERHKQEKDIVEIMKNILKRDGGEVNKHVKVYAYFAHDANIAGLMSALKIFNGRAPPFCAAILVEFHKFDNYSCVKVFYSNSTNPESGQQDVHLMILPDCGMKCCPLDTFVTITRPVIPVDWKKECELQAINSSGSLGTPVWIYYFTSIYFYVISQLYSS